MKIQTRLLVLAVALLLSASASQAMSLFRSEPITDLPADVPATNTLAGEVTFTFYDTETTGLGPQKERIIEIAAIKFQGTNVLEQKQWLLDPGRPIPPDATKIHHITDADVRGKPGFKTVYPEFEQFIRGSVVMAHNAHFDVGFVREECLRNGLRPPPNLALDTLPMFRKWFPQVKRHNLDELGKTLKVLPPDRHRAMADTLEAVLIFQKGIGQQSAAYTFGDLLRDARKPLRFTAP
jgi:DNA polymerase III epsilon subunit family exonuclease